MFGPSGCIHGVSGHHGRRSRQRVPILAYQGVSGSILVYQSVSGSILVYQGVSGFILAYQGVSGSILAYQGGCVCPSVRPSIRASPVRPSIRPFVCVHVCLHTGPHTCERPRGRMPLIDAHMHRSGVCSMAGLFSNRDAGA